MMKRHLNGRNLSPLLNLCYSCKNIKHFSSITKAFSLFVTYIYIFLSETQFPPVTSLYHLMQLLEIALQKHLRACSREKAHEAVSALQWGLDALGL